MHLLQDLGSSAKGEDPLSLVPGNEPLISGLSNFCFSSHPSNYQVGSVPSLIAKFQVLVHTCNN
jgi:hypothetical protein